MCVSLRRAFIIVLFIHFHLARINRQTYNIGVKLRARALMTLPDSTSQKFVLLGQVARQDQTAGDVGRVVTVFLDFSKTRTKKCGESDFEKWYARPANTECLMGHKVCVVVICCF